jgi:Nucleotide modification associated domain 3
MKIALLRVGVDAGCGGMQGPLFRDGSFEFVPIPDDRLLDERTYGNTRGRKGKTLVSYFPERRQPQYSTTPIHFDPEFETFTYGDPTPPKKGLRRLAKGDLLVFYAGLEGFDFESPPALYIIGYFEVELAGLATEFSEAVIRRNFVANFHVRHRALFEKQKHELVLVKGGKASRLLKKAHVLSETITLAGKAPLKKITPAMRKIFGEFGGRHSFQRSPTRWVDPDFTKSAAIFVGGLP